MPPKHKSGAFKRNKRKRENARMESQRGSLNRYFSAAGSVDVNNNNQTQEPEVGQDDDQISNAELEVNDESLDGSK